MQEARAKVSRGRAPSSVGGWAAGVRSTRGLSRRTSSVCPSNALGSRYPLLALVLVLLTTSLLFIGFVDGFDVCALALATPRITVDMTAARVFAAAEEVCVAPGCTLLKRELAAASELPTLGLALDACKLALVAGEAAGTNAEEGLGIAAQLVNTTWMLLDTPLTVLGAGSLPPYTNVQYWRFRYDQLGYAMGHVTATLSSTRAKHVAAITGGTPSALEPALLAFTNGFIFGARAACPTCKVLSHPFAYDDLNQTQAIVDAWDVVSGATTSVTGIATSQPDFTLVTPHPILLPAKTLLRRLSAPSSTVGGKKILTAQWGDAWDWGYDSGVMEGAENLVTSGVVNTEIAVKYILNVGKFYGSGFQYLGVGIGALSLTPCHATAICELFKIGDVQLSPQGYADEIVVKLGAGTVLTQVDPVTGEPKVPYNREPILTEEVPMAGLTMRIDEGMFYTKNFTALDLDGDFLSWSVTGLPGAKMFVRNNEGTSAQLQWDVPYDPEPPGQETRPKGAPPWPEHFAIVRVSDGLGAYQQVNFTLILNDVNRPPDWPQRLPKSYSVKEGENITFTYLAVDPDGGPSTMEAYDLPFGSTFNATTGAFYWAPTYTQSGPHTISIKGTDRFGKVSYATTFVNVINVNFLPKWVARMGENLTVSEGDEITFQFFASDDDLKTPVRYTLDGPTEAKIDRKTGMFTWIVPWDASKYGTRPNGKKFNQYQHVMGDHYVVVSATDSSNVRITTTTVVSVKVVRNCTDFGELWNSSISETSNSTAKLWGSSKLVNKTFGRYDQLELVLPPAPWITTVPMLPTTYCYCPACCRNLKPGVVRCSDGQTLCPATGCNPCPENALWARVVVDVYKRVNFADVLGGRASWRRAKEVQEVQVEVGWRVVKVPSSTSSPWPPKPYLLDDGTLVEATVPTVETWPSAFRPGDNITHRGNSRTEGVSKGGVGPWTYFEVDTTGDWTVAAVISDKVCKPAGNWNSSQLFPYEFTASCNSPPEPAVVQENVYTNEGHKKGLCFPDVFLDASPSIDPEGDPLRVFWAEGVLQTEPDVEIDPGLLDLGGDNVTNVTEICRNFTRDNTMSSGNATGANATITSNVAAACAAFNNGTNGTDPGTGKPMTQAEILAAALAWQASQQQAKVGRRRRLLQVSMSGDAGGGGGDGGRKIGTWGRGKTRSVTKTQRLLSVPIPAFIGRRLLQQKSGGDNSSSMTAPSPAPAPGHTLGTGSGLSITELPLCKKAASTAASNGINGTTTNATNVTSAAATDEIPGVTCRLATAITAASQPVDVTLYNAASIAVASGNVSLAFVSPNATRTQILVARLGKYNILVTVEDGCFRKVIETTVVVAWNPECVTAAAQLGALGPMAATAAMLLIAWLVAPTAVAASRTTADPNTLSHLKEDVLALRRYHSSVGGGEWIARGLAWYRGVQIVVACITRTPGVGAAAQAEGNSGADAFRRFLRCLALDPRGLSQGPYASVYAAAMFAAALGLAQFTAIAGVGMRVLGRVLQRVFKCRAYYKKLIETKGVSSLVTNAYGVGGPGQGGPVTMGQMEKMPPGTPGRLGNPRPPGTPSRPGTPGKPATPGSISKQEERAVDWETMSDGARARAKASNPMHGLTAEEQMAMAEVLKERALDEHVGCFGLAGVGQRLEYFGWFLSLFRSKWTGTGHAALMELMLLPGLQACFASMECVYLDPKKPYPYVATWPETQCFAGFHGGLAVTMCAVATVAYWTALTVAASPDRQPTISLQPGRHRLPHFAVLEVMCCWMLGAADGLYGRAGGAMAAFAAFVAASQLCAHASALRPSRGVLGWHDAGSGVLPLYAAATAAAVVSFFGALASPTGGGADIGTLSAATIAAAMGVKLGLVAERGPNVTWGLWAWSGGGAAQLGLPGGGISFPGIPAVASPRVLLAPADGDQSKAPPRIRAICLVAYADHEGRVLADRWEGSMRRNQRRLRVKELREKSANQGRVREQAMQGGNDDGQAVSRAMLAEGMSGDDKAWIRKLRALLRRVCLGLDPKTDDGDGDVEGAGLGRTSFDSSDPDGDAFDPRARTEDASGLVGHHQGERLHLRDTLHPSPCAAAEQLVLTLRLCRAAVSAAEPMSMSAIEASEGIVRSLSRAATSKLSQKQHRGSAGSAALPLGEQAPWVEDIPQAARPGKDGRPPVTARGAGPLSPSARGRVGGPAVGVAAVTPRHRPGNAFAIPASHVPASRTGVDIAPITPGRKPVTPKVTVPRTPKPSGAARNLKTSLLFPPPTQKFGVSDRLAGIGPSPHRPGAATGTAAASPTETSISANMIRPPPGLGGAVVGFGYTTARYTPGRKKTKLATARGNLGESTHRSERSPRRDRAKRAPDWLRAKRIDFEEGDEEEEGGESGAGVTARVLTYRKPGVEHSMAAAAAAGTLRYVDPPTAPRAKPPSAADTSTAAPPDPQMAAAEAALIARDGPDVLLVAARSALRMAALSALARMLGCDWGDEHLTTVSGPVKHALLERLVQLRLAAELRAVCDDQAEAAEVRAAAAKLLGQSHAGLARSRDDQVLLLQRLEVIDALRWHPPQEARTKFVTAFNRRLVARGMLTVVGISCGDSAGCAVLEMEVGPGGRGGGLWDHGATERPLTREERRAVGRRNYAVSDDVKVAIERKRGRRALMFQEGRGEYAYGGENFHQKDGMFGGMPGTPGRPLTPARSLAGGMLNPDGDVLERYSNASSIEHRAAGLRALEKAYLGPGGRSDDVGRFHPDWSRRLLRRAAALPLNFAYGLLILARVGDARERTLPGWAAPRVSYYALMFAGLLADTALGCVRPCTEPVWRRLRKLLVKEKYTMKDVRKMGKERRRERLAAMGAAAAREARRNMPSSSEDEDEDEADEADVGGGRDSDDVVGPKLRLPPGAVDLPEIDPRDGLLPTSDEPRDFLAEDEGLGRLAFESAAAVRRAHAMASAESLLSAMQDDDPALNAACAQALQAMVESDPCAARIITEFASSRLAALCRGEHTSNRYLRQSATEVLLSLENAVDRDSIADSLVNSLKAMNAAVPDGGSGGISDEKLVAAKSILTRLARLCGLTDEQRSGGEMDGGLDWDEGPGRGIGGEGGGGYRGRFGGGGAADDTDWAMDTAANADRRRAERIRKQEQQMAEALGGRDGTGDGPRAERRDPWSASSAAAPPACLMRPGAVETLSEMLGASDPGLRAGALILLGFVAKEAAAAANAAATLMGYDDMGNDLPATEGAVPGTVRSEPDTLADSLLVDDDGAPLAPRVRPWERRRYRGHRVGGGGDEEEDDLFGPRPPHLSEWNTATEVSRSGPGSMTGSSAVRDAVQDAVTTGRSEVIHRMRLIMDHDEDPAVRALANEIVASLSFASAKYAAAAKDVEADVRDRWHSRAWRAMHRRDAEEGREGKWHAADRGARLTNQIIAEEEVARESDMRTLLAEPKVPPPPVTPAHKRGLLAATADDGSGPLRLGTGTADPSVEEAARRVPDDFASSQLKPLRLPPPPMHDASPDVRAAAAAAAAAAAGAGGALWNAGEMLPGRGPQWTAKEVAENRRGRGRRAPVHTVQAQYKG